MGNKKATLLKAFFYCPYWGDLMNKFMQSVQKDMNNIFTAEFSELKFVHNKEIPIIIDQERLKDRIRKEYEGVIVGEILFYAKASDISFKKEQSIRFGQKLYTVVDIIESQSGVVEVVLTSFSGV